MSLEAGWKTRHQGVRGWPVNTRRHLPVRTSVTRIEWSPCVDASFVLSTNTLKILSPLCLYIYLSLSLFTFVSPFLLSSLSLSIFVSPLLVFCSVFLFKTLPMHRKYVVNKVVGVYQGWFNCLFYWRTARLGICTLFNINSSYCKSYHTRLSWSPWEEWTASDPMPRMAASRHT